MNRSDPVVISAIGMTSSLGQGRDLVFDNLLRGRSNFKLLTREGRQKDSAFIGAQIDEIVVPKGLAALPSRGLSLSGQVAAVTLFEAFQEAHLEGVSPQRIGLVIGGTNIQQRELLLMQERYRETPCYLRPYYGFSFMDSDLLGFCSELCHIQGPGFIVGGASASGQMALIRATHMVDSGEVDACIVLGALMDVSYFELYAFQALGAMAPVSEAQAPNACRPMDKKRKGFVYGENCAAIVVEAKSHAQQRGLNPYVEICGFMAQMDGHRNPDPSIEAEIAVIKNVLAQAGLTAADIDYINPHATGSLLGDEVEYEALKACQLQHALINTTKSILGHGLSAAGAIELAVTALQMQRGWLHPSLNLKEPIGNELNWLGEECIKQDIRHALCLSFGFGGINTAVCLRNSKASN